VADAIEAEPDWQVTHHRKDFLSYLEGIVAFRVRKQEDFGNG